MNVRDPILRLATLLLSCLATSAAGGVGLTITDTCGRSLSGSATSTNPDPVVVDSSGNIAVVGYGPGSYAAGVGQCDALPPDGKPICTISASSTRVAKGGTVTLFAKCSATTSLFTWSGPAGGPAVPSGAVAFNSQSLTFPKAGAYSYSVSGTSSVPGPTSPPVTILVGDATDSPTCVLTISPAAIAQGESATAQVACQPQTTDIVWDAAEANAPAFTGASSTKAFSTAGAFTYKVLGRNGSPVVSGPKASATVTVKSNSTCTAGPVSDDRSSPPLVAGLSPPYPNYWYISQDAVMTFSFTVTTLASFTVNYPGPYPFPDTWTWSISRCKGDFPVGSCTQTFSSSSATLVAYTTSNYPQLYCMVQPNTTYYLNIKALSCPGGLCSFSINRWGS